MADTKLTALINDATPTSDDLLYSVSDPAGTPVSRKVTIANLAVLLTSIFNYIFRSGNGWTEVDDTWTYASASTINIPSDGTTTYQKGMKIRFKQGGGYSYFIVYSVTVTLITIFINDDGQVANDPITDIAYSFEEKPYGWPDFFAYTPTLAKLPSFTTAAYRVSGNTVHVIFEAVNKTLTAGAGIASFTLPAAAVYTMIHPSTCATVSGTTFQTNSYQTTAASNVLAIYKTGAVGNWAGGEVVDIWVNHVYRY